MSTPTEILTLQQAAEYLHVHPNTVYRLARKGELPAFKIGTDWRFRRASIDSWIESRQEAKRLASGEDVFHVVFWLASEGLSLTVGKDAVTNFLDLTPQAAQRELRRLVGRGYLTESRALGRAVYALTPEGLEEARRLFARRRSVPSGHESVAAFAAKQVGCALVMTREL